MNGVSAYLKSILIVVLGVSPTALLAKCIPANLETAATPNRVASLEQVDGQSCTLLFDGRFFLAGGQKSSAVTAAAFFQDVKTGKLTKTPSPLQLSRAFHSATLLPNGQILIFGGVGDGGAIVAKSEIFEVTSERFAETSLITATPRSHHTATVLTDGRVLIAGGLDGGGHFLSEIEVWDYRTNQVTTLAATLRTPRINQSAILQADGSVLLWGGESETGGRLNDGEIIDPSGPSVRLVSTFREGHQESLAPQLAASIPQSGETGTPTDQIIALRFSEPLSVTSLNTNTVILRSAKGDVPIKVVPAEDGMLAFITPIGMLQHDSAYTVSVSGAMDSAGQLLRNTSIIFTTVVSPAKEVPVSGTGIAGSGSSGPGNVSGAAAGTDARASQWRKQAPLRAQDGVTALSGLVLTLDGSPLPNVSIEIDNEKARTDKTGRFLVQNTGSGHHMMIVDGAPASTKSKTYGLYRVGVDLKAGVTNTLNYTFWMTELDTEHVVSIDSPTKSDVVITNPTIPGLELHIPVGTVIRDARGNLVTKVGLTQLSTTQPPFPIKKGVHFPVYFTIQPGGATFQNAGRAWSPAISSRGRGATIHYKNYTKSKPGSRQTFWNYDPAQRGWYSYGKGRVSANAKMVVPEDGTQIFSFDAASVDPGNPNLAPQPAPKCCNPSDGDPVDLQTGLFVYNRTDLVLNDVIPLQLTRTYRQGDTISRAFGIGTALNYDIFFVGDFDNSAAGETYQDLIFADGGQVHFVQTSPCSAGGCPGPDDDGDAIFTATSTPGDFYGATNQLLRSGAPYWNLKKADGTQYFFRQIGEGSTEPRDGGMAAVVDRSGNAVLLNRDFGTGNLLSVTSPNGRWIQFTYDSSNRITSAQDNAGRTTSYTYNSQGCLASATDANGGVTSYSYDGDCNMLSITNPRGIVYLQNQYDANDMVSQQTHADGGIYKFSYTLDPYGNVTQTNVTDPRGYQRAVTFNADGYMTSDTRAVGQPEQRTITYNRQQGTGIFLSMTDALNRTTAYSYDAMANVTSATQLSGTPDAVTTSYAYDQRFYETSAVTDPLGNTASYVYDDNGNMLATTDPLGNSTSFTYNSAGQPTTVTDSLGNQTQFGYNAGDLVSITDPLGRTSTRFVDAAGRVVSSTDPLGHATRTNYDPLDEVTATIDPLGSQTAMTYNPNGDLLSVTDANQHTTSYVFDEMDRVLTRKDPLQHQEGFQYDLSGNLKQTTDRKGQVTSFLYDGLNRLTQIGFNDASTVTNSHDAGDRVTSIVDTQSGTISRSYDGLDRLTSETTSQGSVGYTYDADGRRQTMNISGQPQVSYNFDNASRLTSIIQGGTNVSFTYDADNRRASLTLPNGITASYSYDAASQLTEILYQGGTVGSANLAYTYDLAGRRSAVSGSLASTQLPQAVSNAVYNVNNQLTNWGSTAMIYDANGNTLNDGMNSYAWDARNRLISANNNGATFAYDPVGRRTGRNILSVNTNYLYDGANPVQELNGSTITANLLTGAIDERFTRTDSTGTSNYLTDALGSTVALTDPTGRTQVQYSYAPYGSVDISGTTNNSYTYTGRESDGLGLYYYRARYYNPTTGRFLSEDPLGFAGSGTNFYAYVHNSPTNLIDPFGLADVYIWNFRGKNQAWGHVSMTLDDGTHISWWPSDEDRDYLFGTSKIPIYTAPAFDDQTLEDDTSYEEQGPDEVIHLDGLDEAAIAKWWQEYQKNRDWKTLSRNCSTTIAKALRAGGAHPGHHLIWTPEKIREYVERLAAGKTR